MYRKPSRQRVLVINVLCTPQTVKKKRRFPYIQGGLHQTGRTLATVRLQNGTIGGSLTCKRVWRSQSNPNGCSDSLEHLYLRN